MSPAAMYSPAPRTAARGRGWGRARAARAPRPPNPPAGGRGAPLDAPPRLVGETPDPPAAEPTGGRRRVADRPGPRGSRPKPPPPPAGIGPAHGPADHLHR